MKFKSKFIELLQRQVYHTYLFRLQSLRSSAVTFPSFVLDTLPARGCYWGRDSDN
jgi:hypothetical protein